MKGRKGLEACASSMRQDFFQPLTRDEIPNSRQHGTQSSDVFSDQFCFQTSNLRGYEQTTFAMAEHFVFVRKRRLVLRLPRTAPRCYTLLGNQY